MFIGLLLLFGSSFLSATVLPGNSELALGLFFHQWPAAWLLAILVATIGNTLGGMTSWWLGRLIPEDRLNATMVQRIRRYGVWLLLFSWVPLVGDALCVAAGWLRTPLLMTATVMLVGKSIRYVVIIWILKSVAG